MRKAGPVIALLIVLAVGVAACSLPTDDTAQPIEQEELAPSLQREPPAPTSTVTSPPQNLTRDFAYYLLAPRPDTEQREVRQVITPIDQQATLFEAIEPMEIEGFKETIGADPTLINIVLRYDVVNAEIDGGVATVYLLTLDDVPENPVLQDVAAQLVWTVTGWPDVEALRINIDGAPQELPTTNDPDNLVARPVTIEDYGAYDQAFDDGTETTTSTTTTTTTTVPPDDGAS